MLSIHSFANNVYLYSLYTPSLIIDTITNCYSRLTPIGRCFVVPDGNDGETERRLCFAVTRMSVRLTNKTHQLSGCSVVKGTYKQNGRVIDGKPLSLGCFSYSLRKYVKKIEKKDQ